jgi:hypothetical protein
MPKPCRFRIRTQLSAAALCAVSAVWLTGASLLAGAEDAPSPPAGPGAPDAPDAPGGPGGGPRGPAHGPKPSEAAYSACKGLEEEDVCKVDFRGHEIDGTCVTDADNGVLFCRTEHPPEPPR